MSARDPGLAPSGGGVHLYTRANVRSKASLDAISRSSSCNQQFDSARRARLSGVGGPPVRPGVYNSNQRRGTGRARRVRHGLVREDFHRRAEHLQTTGGLPDLVLRHNPLEHWDVHLSSSHTRRHQRRSSHSENPIEREISAPR